jgi:hypothetical protein
MTVGLIKEKARGFMKVKIFWFIVLVFLFGCSKPKPIYVRTYHHPSLTEEDLKRDRNECFSLVIQDPQFSSLDLDKQLVMETGPSGTTIFRKMPKEFNQKLDECLRGRGYTWTYEEKE